MSTTSVLTVPRNFLPPSGYKMLEGIVGVPNVLGVCRVVLRERDGRMCLIQYSPSVKPVAGATLELVTAAKLDAEIGANPYIPEDRPTKREIPDDEKEHLVPDFNQDL
ncbi:hypothetical protein [Pendulispora albinea]|uniref:Uncharacterized protein n=1 Tax=Pendulispora albinea TaxID=2741071 RepID=A0ABZ2M866_9BACT